MSGYESSVTAKDFFNNKSYVILESTLSVELCKNLAEHLFKIHAEGKTFKDKQCPLSDSVYGDVRLDGILEKLAEPVGKHIGLDLTPTYSYARIYRHGEVLPPHLDRPACEISGTMTLGFDDISVWPIFFSDIAIENSEPVRADLNIGDLLIYRGEELCHWRTEFRGDWQCQVFFHFVDSNGIHVGEAFDGRDHLGVTPAPVTVEKDAVTVSKPKKTVKAPMSDKNSNSKIHGFEMTVLPKKQQTRPAVFPIFGGVMIPSWDLTLPGMITYTKNEYPLLVFTESECDSIKKLANSGYAADGSVGKGEISKGIRNVNLYQIPIVENTRWVFDKVAKIASMANNEYYDYEIMGLTHELQLLHYESGSEPGHYDWHQDMGGMQMSTRKISISVQLSDPNTYTGGELLVSDGGVLIRGCTEQGSITCFPSYTEHKVSAMETGERWSLVMWVHGSRRFR